MLEFPDDVDRVRLETDALCGHSQANHLGATAHREVVQVHSFLGSRWLGDIRLGVKKRSIAAHLCFPEFDREINSLLVQLGGNEKFVSTAKCDINQQRKTCYEYSTCQDLCRLRGTRETQCEYDKRSTTPLCTPMMSSTIICSRPVSRSRINPDHIADETVMYPAAEEPYESSYCTLLVLVHPVFSRIVPEYTLNSAIYRITESCKSQKAYAEYTLNIRRNHALETRNNTVPVLVALRVPAVPYSYSYSYDTVLVLLYSTCRSSATSTSTSTSTSTLD